MVAPVDMDEAVARMRTATIPRAIHDITKRLHEAGHAAVLVGGAVRDTLLGSPSADFDVASSATPEEVIAIFPRTIPTGVEHGTVTVLSGRGEEREAVEVTTFRGEGAYLDGRRPTEVRFLRELEDDLARRDFTVNAFAWDPHRGEFTDAFGGLEDLRAGVVRAVGVAEERFAEDGLRTMRAVRFCASLGFSLDPPTEAAIAPTLEVFDKVARERVRVELFKLLGGVDVRAGLEPMARTGLWPRVLPALGDVARERAIASVERLERDPVLRLCALLRPVRADRASVEAALEALRPSRADRARVLATCGAAFDAFEAALGEGSPSAIRRAAAALGRGHLDDARALLELNESETTRLSEALEGAALQTKELALKGGELVAGGVLEAGPGLGAMLRRLLEWVHEDPSRNERERLLAQARAWVEASDG